MMRKVKSLVMIGVLTLVAGCATMEKVSKTLFGDGRNYVIHLHEFSTMRTDKNEMNAVEYIPGKFIYPKKEPVISSPNISKIEVIQMPTGKSLKLVLDGHGRTVWTQTTARLKGKQLVIMVDDKYRGWIRLTRIDQDGVIVLPGPFTDDEVKNILNHAETNRKRY